MENNNNKLRMALVAACAVGITTLAFRYFFLTPRPVFFHAGCDFLPMKLVSNKEVSPNTRVFRFALEHPEQILGVHVGSHVMLRANINGETVTRSYTPISCDDDRGYVEFVIKVYFGGVDPKFPGGGKMSQHLEKLKIGDTIDAKGPTGKFDYRGKGEFKLKAAGHHVTKKVSKMGMIAGGTGITPMLQIIRAILKDPSDKTEMSLLFANHTEADILLRKELDECAKDPRFRVWYTLSHPPTEEQGNKKWKYSSGRIDYEMIDQHLPSPGPDTVVLMCGPPAMIQHACKPNLEKKGFQNEAMIVF